MLIAVVNKSTVPAVTAQAVQDYCTAQAHQLRYNFCPAWAVSVPAVVPYPSVAAVPSGAQLVLLLDTSDQKGALAYHTELASGVKVAEVFVKTLLGAGLTWTSGASHEVLEMTADPSCNRSCAAGNGDVYDLEVCDPVESDGYMIGAIEVSDFVFPAWFDPQAPNGARTRQMATHGKPNLAPFELAAGGYAIVNGQAVFADKAAEELRALKGGGGHSSLRIR